MQRLPMFACREPAKYVATLRHLQLEQHVEQQQSVGMSSTSNKHTTLHHKPLILMTDLQAGHFAASAASSKLEERAIKVAFLLSNLSC